MLELRRLQALQAVVGSGSVKDAAARLGYTPSAVSQHITTLERETKTVLLEPAGRGVRPTPAGQLLATHAASLLDRLAEAEAALAALTAGETGVLRLASFATAGPNSSPRPWPESGPRCRTWRSACAWPTPATRSACCAAACSTSP